MAGDLTVGDLTANAWLNPDGSENYRVRAWVSFNGTGTLAIKAKSINVSSVTDLGTGQYRVNFYPNLPDTNYVALFSGGDTNNFLNVVSIQVTHCDLHVREYNNTYQDQAINSVAIIY